MKKLISQQLAGRLLFMLLTLLSLFHIAVLAGFFPYQIVWGGQLDKESLMLMEGSALLITILFLLVITVRSRIIKAPRFQKIAHLGSWIIFGYFSLNIIASFTSTSGTEQAIFTPLSIIMALLTLRVSLKP